MRMVIREIKQAVLHSAAVMSVGRRDARCAGLIFFVKHLSDLLASFENWDWDYILPHDFLCLYFLASVQQEDPKAVTIESWTSLSTHLDMFSAMKASNGLFTAGREFLAENWDKPESGTADQARNICRVYTMGE
ncbi:conserved hypothetical protein [Aspergillus fumigatus A1163]|uniref:Uncharacterized protein n=1 Tax=Aspergillus fumigatus (strain CBS 144.89 / FGSC A1163 / CEA10) TaxID=451804 RepID=B0YBA4_ASPFC|nr:conserved hypothetical protein [Aspergillus fumigatus A1163]